MKLFSPIRYHISPSYTPEHRQLLHHLLQNNGAEEAEGVKAASHVITNSLTFEGWQEVEEGIVIVTDKWLERSILLGKLQPPHYYSANPALIFSGVIACATELPPQDLEVLSAGILALGGQWRTGLTKEVTHLFALSNTSTKYTTALHYQDQTNVKVLLPHWFDDSVRLGIGGLATAPYEWPDPPLLKPNNVGGEADKVKRAMAVEHDPMKRSLYSTAIKEGDVKPVWAGRTLLLSHTLMLTPSRLDAVHISIERAGGRVLLLPSEKEEEGMVAECDVYITRWREGRAYVRAYRAGKTIGTLAWLYHVQSVGTVTRPLDQLLHYPIPSTPIEGFSHHEITVTNYTGEAREYLKKLITTMGASFTPSMSSKNTALIAAFTSLSPIKSIKAAKALSWSIPIVNHTWLEDCFVRWRNLTVATEKYACFPEGLDFSEVLGERGIGVGRVIEEEVEEMEGEFREEDERAARGGGGEAMDVDAPPGTAASANEVQALVDGDGDAVMQDHGRDDEQDQQVEEVDGDFQPRQDKDDDDEPPLPQPRKSPVKTSTKGKKPQVESDTEDEVELDAQTNPEVDEDESEDEVVTKKKPAKKMKAKANAKAKKMQVDSEDEDEDMEVEKKAGISSSPSKKKTPQKKKKPSPPTVSDDEEEEEEAVPSEPPSETNDDDDDDEGIIITPSEPTSDGSDSYEPSATSKKKHSTPPAKKKPAGKSAVKPKSATAKKTPQRMKKKVVKNSDSEEDEVEVVENVRPRARAGGGRKGAVVSDEDEMGDDDDDDSAMVVVVKDAKRRKSVQGMKGQGENTSLLNKKKVDATTRVKRRVSQIPVVQVEDDEDDEEEEEEEEEIVVRKPLTRKSDAAIAGSTKKGTRKVVAEESDEEEEEEERVTAKTKTKAKAAQAVNAKGKGKCRAKIVHSESEDDDEEEEDTIIVSRKPPVVQSSLKSKPPPKGKSKTQKKAASPSDDENESSDSSILPRTIMPPKVVPGKATAVTTNVQAKAKARNAAAEKKGRKANSKRAITVLKPDFELGKKGKKRRGVVVEEEEEEEEEGEETQEDEEVEELKSPLTRRRSSLAAVEAQASKTTTPKSSAKSTAVAAKSKGQPKPKSAAPPKALAASASRTTVAVVIPVGPGATAVSAGPSKRLAATKATAKLHNEIMPDLVNFESQMRKSRKSGGGVAGFVVDGDTVMRVEENSVGSGVSAKRVAKRKSVGSGETAGDTGGEEGTEAGEVGSEKGRKRMRGAEENVAKAGSSKAKGDDSTSDGRQIRLATTQGVLPEDVIKTLTKLGVTMTSKASECTHLLATGIVRTEKFLCAIAVGAHILKRDWALDCAKANKMLPEKKYTLKDPNNKYGLDLEESLARARKGKLMEGKVFYVAGKTVSSSVGLLKNVVSACGGQLKEVQKLTQRILAAGPDRYAISSQADVSVWRSLAEQGSTVYSVELVLAGTLHQKLDLDLYRLQLDDD